MNPITVISADPAAKAAVERVIVAKGFPVDLSPEPPAVSVWEPKCQWLVHTTCEAYRKLFELDQEFVGTTHYMGIAYFWHHAYRHYLRDATTTQRVEVHDAFIKARLPLAGESEVHFTIVRTITGKR